MSRKPKFTPEQIAEYERFALANGGTVRRHVAVIPPEAIVTPSKAPTGKLTEAAFQKQVIEYAQERGWRCAHFRRVRVTRGTSTFWETPVAADGKGFPDLIMLREGRMVVAELKVPPNKPDHDQKLWLAGFRQLWHLGRNPTVQVFVWMPCDWPAIKEILA